MPNVLEAPEMVAEKQVDDVPEAGVMVIASSLLLFL